MVPDPIYHEQTRHLAGLFDTLNTFLYVRAPL